ncbi:hypothetical protein GYMLUDRAFT_166855, partial [Collybiopsis luxurians FD-317 M1]
SDEIKQRALQMVSEGWDITEIVQELGVSTKSISHWQDNYDTHGHVNPHYPVHGRCQILSSSTMLEIQQLLAEDPSLYLDEILEWLAIFHDWPISLSALCKNLKDFGLDRKVMRRVANQQDEVSDWTWMHRVTCACCGILGPSLFASIVDIKEDNAAVVPAVVI